MPHLDAREKSPDIFVQSRAARNLGPNHGHVGQGENDTVAFRAPRKLLGDEVPSHEFLAESRVVEQVLLGGALLCSLEVSLNDDLVNVLDEFSVAATTCTKQLSQPPEAIGVGVLLAFLRYVIDAVVVHLVSQGGDTSLDMDVLCMPLHPSEGYGIGAALRWAMASESDFQRWPSVRSCQGLYG